MRIVTKQETEELLALMALVKKLFTYSKVGVNGKTRVVSAMVAVVAATVGFVITAVTEKTGTIQIEFRYSGGIFDVWSYSATGRSQSFDYGDKEAAAHHIVMLLVAHVRGKGASDEAPK